MSKTQLLQVRILPDMLADIETVAIQRGMMRADGEANVSEAARYVIDLGLTSARLRYKRESVALTERVRSAKRAYGVGQVRGDGGNGK